MDTPAHRRPMWTDVGRRQPLVSISSEVQERCICRWGPLELRCCREPLSVESLPAFRKVAADSFRPNFFLVLPPGCWCGGGRRTYDQRSIDAHARPGAGRSRARIPTIFGIRRRRHLKADPRDHDGFAAVQYVFLFTLRAGIVVLLAAVASDPR